jgi:hypothetical protein
MRTNLSTMWDLHTLRRFLSRITTPLMTLAGVWDVQQGIRYVSGSGILMTRDVADLLIAQAASVSRTLLDDLALGRWFAQLTISQKLAMPR